MRALSVRQPYASQIRDGVKTIELRSWPTRYRGDVLIVASKFKCKEHESLPRGVAMCVARIADCRPFTPEDAKDACAAWRQGLYSFVMENVRPVPPAPIKGQLYLFNVEPPPEILRAIDSASHPGPHQACTPAA